MAQTRKSRNRSRRVTRRRRASLAGKILPPLDVRSTKSLSELERRIKKGPLTIVMVYADWCGHCHTMAPHFDAAAKSPNRSVQAVKINEAVLNQVNSHMSKNMGAKPIKVEGYPSIIMINKNGEKVTDVETVRSTPTMTKLMEESGTLAEEAGLSNTESVETKANINAREGVVAEKNVEGSLSFEALAQAPATVNKVSVKNRISLEEGAAPSPINSFSAPKNGPKSAKLSKEELESIGALTSTTAITDMPALPPSTDSDLIRSNSSKNVGQTGGSLYGALTRSAYQLAPTAILLGIASGTIKRNTYKKSKGKSTNKAHKKSHGGARKTHKKSMHKRR